MEFRKGARTIPVVEANIVLQKNAARPFAKQKLFSITAILRKPFPTDGGIFK
jgi:hypothetical protein